MGAWGVEPYENDTALDFLGEVWEINCSLVQIGLQSRYAEAALAAARLLLDLPQVLRCHSRVEFLAAEAVDVVEQAIASVAKQGWEDPDRRTRCLKALLRKLRVMQRECKSCTEPKPVRLSWFLPGSGLTPEDCFRRHVPYTRLAPTLGYPKGELSLLENCPPPCKLDWQPAHLLGDWWLRYRSRSAGNRGRRWRYPALSIGTKRHFTDFP